MAEHIVRCEQCHSTNIDIIDKYKEQLENSTSTTITVEGKCNECGNIIEFSTWTKIGEHEREWGKDGMWGHDFVRGHFIHDNGKIIYLDDVGFDKFEELHKKYNTNIKIR